MDASNDHENRQVFFQIQDHSDGARTHGDQRRNGTVAQKEPQNGVQRPFTQFTINTVSPGAEVFQHQFYLPDKKSCRLKVHRLPLKGQKLLYIQLEGWSTNMMTFPYPGRK